MRFILEQAKQLGMVTLIMTCATGGTVGLLKVIRKVLPSREFPEDSILRKSDEKGDF